jgi:hypothetical protein
MDEVVIFRVVDGPEETLELLGIAMDQYEVCDHAITPEGRPVARRDARWASRRRKAGQVLVPRKAPGSMGLGRDGCPPVDLESLRPLGPISTLRDRVCMAAAMLVLEPIFEADLPPEQYAYRPGRNAQQAVVEVEKLLFRGHRRRPRGLLREHSPRRVGQVGSAPDC